MPKLITLAEDAYNDLKAGVESLVKEAQTIIEGLEHHHTSVTASTQAVATGAPSVPPVTPAPTASALATAAAVVNTHLASPALLPVQNLAPKPHVAGAVSRVHTDTANRPAAVPGTPPHAVPQPPAPAAPATA